MKEVNYKELSFNPSTMIMNEWMLITAGDQSGFNTMTASWGQLGSLWANGGGLPTATVFIRPQRYTKEFIDRESFFTLSFFATQYKKQLAYLGSHPGRDENKVAKTGLTPVFGEGYTYFDEAKLVLVCRKLYSAPFAEEGFVDTSLIRTLYPNRDYHVMYVGEIIKALAAE